MATNQFDYEQALAFIHGAYGKGEKRGQENMYAMLERLGNPHQTFRSIHVAGTNGKGSVCAFTQAILRCGGYKTGLYTSPFLQRYNERMRIDGLPIPDERLANLTSRVADVVDALRTEGVKPTEFEIGTAIAFLYFAEERVDVAVIEAGLGGRLDPTNVLNPMVTAIAAIGLDHTRVLGDTLELIAKEKAGIAKHDVPMVVSSQNGRSVLDVIENHCKKTNSPFLVSKPSVGFGLGLVGAYQHDNAGVAVSIMDSIRLQGMHISEEQIADGLKRTRWPGRLEWIAQAPDIILDGAHNEQGAESLQAYVASLNRRSVVLVCGVLQDKDWPSIMRKLAEISPSLVVTVRPDTHRALDANTLSKAFIDIDIPAISTKSLEEAVCEAKQAAGLEGLIVIAGSLYLVGEARTFLLGREDTLLAPEMY